MFLLKGTDKTTISTIFSVKRQGDVSRYLSQARVALMKNFVNNNLGAASLNDAAILLNILEKDIELGKLIKQNDFFIVDRGFRDCVDVLEKKYNLMV
jgi:hypothetical protein